MNTVNKNRTAKNNFDFLRFFFAFIVVLAHLIDLTGLDWLKPYKVYIDSKLAVAGFFVISGHLIYGSYLRAHSFKSYLLNRAKRLLPAYGMLVIAAPLFLGLISTYSYQAFWMQAGTLKYLIANLSCLNFIAPCLPGVFANNTICAVNGALWTIKIEIGFYLCLPILVLLLKRFHKKTLFYMMIYGSSILYLIVLNTMNILKPTHTALFELLEHQLPAYLSYFAAGMYLYDFKSNLLGAPKYIYLIAFCDCILEYSFEIELLFPLCIAILVIGFAYHFPRLNHWGKYGDISYGIYLIHFPMIQIAVQMGYFLKYPFILVAGNLVLIVFLFAMLSWHLIEKKFLALR